MCSTDLRQRIWDTRRDMSSITIGRVMLGKRSIILYDHATNTKSQVVHGRWATTRVISHGMALSSLLRREWGWGHGKGVGLRGGIPRGGGRLVVQIDVKTLRRETRLRPSKRPIILNMRVRLCHKTLDMFFHDSRYVERR
jgi:hypothetical protein